MEKIKELVVGRVVEEKIINEETKEKEIVVVNPGFTIKGKGSFFFTQKADELYSSTDKEGNETDGVSTIFNELTMYNDLALIKFWHCAAANHGNNAPSKDDIIIALQDAADKHGTAPLFAGALDVFMTGYYRDKIANQDLMMQLAVSKEKDPVKKEELQGQIEMLKQMREKVANPE